MGKQTVNSCCIWLWVKGIDDKRVPTTASRCVFYGVVDTNRERRCGDLEANTPMLVS